MTTLWRSHSSPGNIPFLWEHLPGISKITDDQTNKISSPSKASLPPPPPCSSTVYSSSGLLSRRSIYVPLPPCPFVPTRELSLAKKGTKKIDDHDDPFLAAFKECTRCNKKEKRKSVKEKVIAMKIFSCKYDVGVRKDVMIRVHDGKKFMEVKGDLIVDKSFN